MFDEALALHQAGRLAEAESLYSRILAVEPRHADVLHLLGVIAHQSSRNLAAAELIGAAIAIEGRSPAYHANLGIVLQALGRLDEAVAAYGAALGLKPDYAEAHYNLGNAWKDLGRLEAAVDAYEAAARFSPDYAPARYNLGFVLTGLGRLNEAVAAYRAAVRVKPDYAEAHSNLGAVLKSLGRPEEACIALRMALALKPDYAEAASNLGAALKDLGRFEEAIAACDVAVALRPDYAEAHYNGSFPHFLLGDLAAGWPKFEWRWLGGNHRMKPRRFASPQWRGEDIEGRTILLHAEQGLGDTIQFCRYAPLVAARGAQVILEAPHRLLRLLSGLQDVDRLAAAGDPLPDFDFHCPLMSLPGVFETALDTIPAPIPYLAAEDKAVERWRGRIGPEGFKIGIVWQGNPALHVDQGRSAPLAGFAPLAAIPGVRLIGLQKGPGVEQLNDLPPGMRVETLGPDFDDGPDAFVDSAAVMMNLDLVVTVCTSAAHPAGALGRPTWLALKAVPHWVWMMDREDTPWYPTMRLFRQTERGDWAGVFRRMETELRKRP